MKGNRYREAAFHAFLLIKKTYARTVLRLITLPYATMHTKHLPGAAPYFIQLSNPAKYFLAE